MTPLCHTSENSSCLVAGPFPNKGFKNLSHGIHLVNICITMKGNLKVLANGAKTANFCKGISLGGEGGSVAQEVIPF